MLLETTQDVSSLDEPDIGINLLHDFRIVSGLMNKIINGSLTNLKMCNLEDRLVAKWPAGLTRGRFNDGRFNEDVLYTTYLLQYL